MDNEHPRARLYYLFGVSRHPQHTSWLARLPASAFGVSVGLFGLTGAWRRAAASGWRLAQDAADLLIWPVTAIWLLSLALYALKCRRHPSAVLAEFRHPVQGPQQALIPMSTLLAIMLLGRPDQGIWLVLALVALGLSAVIAYRVVSVLATGEMPANAITPALYLPFVGGALVGAMTMATLGYQGWGAMLFGAGLSGWALLEARVLSSLFAGPMPEALRPTIGVELAPPVVATLSAATVWPQLPGDILAIGLGVAIPLFAGVLARYRWWGRVPFSLGFWSFSFPLAALASVVIEAVRRGGWPLWIGSATLVAASVAVALLLAGTLVLLLRGRLLPVD